MKGKQEKENSGAGGIVFETPPVITAAASTVGKKEGDGPLGTCFDRLELDPMLGKKTWEEAESELQSRTAGLVIEKIGLSRRRSGTRLRAIFWRSSLRHRSGMNLRSRCSGLYGPVHDGRRTEGWVPCAWRADSQTMCS